MLRGMNYANTFVAILYGLLPLLVMLFVVRVSPEQAKLILPALGVAAFVMAWLVQRFIPQGLYNAGLMQGALWLIFVGLWNNLPQTGVTSHHELLQLSLFFLYYFAINAHIKSK